MIASRKKAAGKKLVWKILSQGPPTMCQDTDNDQLATFLMQASQESTKHMNVEPISIS